MSEKTAECIEILLVEDNPGDVELTKRILKKSKFDLNFHIAKDGEQAISVLRRQGTYANVPRPYLILLDLNMPKMDGFQVLEMMRKDSKLNAIPVMILTSTDGERDRLYGLGISPNRYCRKPLDLSQFDTLITMLKSRAVAPETQLKPSIVEEQPEEESTEINFSATIAMRPPIS